MTSHNKILEKVLYEDILNKNIDLFKKNFNTYYVETYSNLVKSEAQRIRDKINDSIR